MPDAQWYPVYDTSTNDVKGAGFFAEPENVELQAGEAMGQGQAGEIPNDLIAEDGTSNYTYDTNTGAVAHK